MSTSFVGDITHIPFMNTSTTGMCVLQTTDEVAIGGYYNSTLEQGQCFVLTVLTLPQTAPERMSNVGHSRTAIGQSEGRCPLTCTGHPPCRTTWVKGKRYQLQVESEAFAVCGSSVSAGFLNVELLHGFYEIFESDEQLKRNGSFEIWQFL